MAKDLADRGQTGPSPQQLTGQGVAQPVWPHSREPRTRAGPLHDVTDQVRPDRSTRGSTGEEHVAGSLRVAPARQVGHEGLTDLRRQRQPVLAPSLTAHDEFPRPPVHIPQLQTRDLDRPQTQPRDQHHDREVPDADRAAAVAAVEQPLDVRDRQRGRRQRGEPPSTHRRHRRPERQRGEAFHVQESQDRAQLSHPSLGRPRRDTAALAEQERVDIHPGQPGGLEPLLRRRLFLQETARGVPVAQHRGRGQAALLAQPGPIPPQQRAQRGHDRLRRRDDPSLPQIAHQRRHRTRPRDPPVTGGAPGGEEPGYPLLIQLRRFQPLRRRPPADPAQVVQHVLDRPRRVPPLRQPRPVALDLRAQHTGLPRPARHRTRLPRREPSAPGDPRLLSTRNYAETQRARTTQKTTAITRPTDEHRRPRHSRGVGIGR
jgi:hypothetical protein